PDELRLMGRRARQWIKANRQWSNAGTVFRTALESAGTLTDSDAAYEDERPLKSYTVAFIGDTFTSDTFIPELTAIPIRPDNWREVYANETIDALFIESAWRSEERRVGKESS